MEKRRYILTQTIPILLGELILSGIIDERADEVENHFKKAGFSIERRVERDGWTMLLAARA